MLCITYNILAKNVLSLILCIKYYVLNNYYKLCIKYDKLCIQGQLAITGASWCDYCIYTPLGISIERIVPEKHFWKDSVEKLDQFFDNYVIPLLCSVNLQCADQMLYYAKNIVLLLHNLQYTYIKPIKTFKINL